MDILTLIVLGISTLVVIGVVLGEMIHQSGVLLGAVVLIGYAISLDVVFSWPVLAFVTANWLAVVLYVLVYFVLGFVYAVAWRFPKLVAHNSAQIEQDFKRWVKSPITNEGNTFEDFLQSTSYHFTIKKQMHRIANWSFYWLPLITFNIAANPFMFVWKAIYPAIGVYIERRGLDVARHQHQIHASRQASISKKDSE